MDFAYYFKDLYLAGFDYHSNLPLAIFDSVNFMDFVGSLHLVFLRKGIELNPEQEVH